MSEKKVRVTLDLSQEAYRRLETLERATESTSKVEVLRDALRLYEYLVTKRTEGYTITLIKEGETRVMELWGITS